MPFPIFVRRAQLSDAETIADFNVRMAEETEKLSLNPITVARGVRRLMERPAFGFYTVAENEGRVVGCALITYEWTDWRDGVFWWLQSVYVLPDARGKGVFRTLFSHLAQESQADPDVRGFRLYAEHDNQTAQRTYLNLGFEKTHYDMLEVSTETLSRLKK